MEKELKTKLKIARYYIKGWREKSYLIYRNNKIYYRFAGDYNVMSIEDFNEFFNDLAKRIYKEDLTNNLLIEFNKLGYKTI